MRTTSVARWGEASRRCRWQMKPWWWGEEIGKNAKRSKRAVRQYFWGREAITRRSQVRVLLPPPKKAVLRNCFFNFIHLYRWMKSSLCSDEIASDAAERHKVPQTPRFRAPTPNLWFGKLVGFFYPPRRMADLISSKLCILDFIGHSPISLGNIEMCISCCIFKK